MEHVKDIRNWITKDASVVKEDTPLSKVAEEVIKDPKTTAIYVTNKEDKLVGIIPVTELVQYLYYEYIPEDYILYNFPLIISREATAQDIMLPPVYVKDDDSITTAFQRMFNNRLNEVPVVDDDLHIIGDLNMLELIKAWLKSVKNAN